MFDRPHILLLDSSESDIELAKLLLQQAFPDSNLAGASDAATLLGALRGPAPTIVIAAPRLDWADLEQILELARSTWPQAAIVLFGDEQELVNRCLTPALAINAVARKSSAGFMALPALVREILGRLPALPAALEAWPLPAVEITSEGRIAAANAAFATTLETPLDELIGAPVASRLAAGERTPWTTFLHGQAPTATLRLANFDGMLELKRDPSGGLLGCLVGVSAAASIRVLGDTDGTVPRELEDVALLFSHDLKEPVQQVMRLVRRLETTRGSDPHSEEKLLRQVHDCAARAANMLDGLLAYITVSARDARPALIELDASLADAIDELRVAIDDSGARISAEPLPAVVGDAVQMAHLFQNLLGNAIKFRGPDTPVVHITCETADGRHRIAVHDNGIGISADHRERVFEMGKRLHTQEEFPGSGMGLALCRRIAERHGGSIHIETGAQQGSVVVIELPQPPSHVTRLA